jgi:ATP-dependent RNA helicase DDX56/DBP9
MSYTRDDNQNLMIRSLKGEAPDVIISTPTKLLSLLESKSIDLSHLCFLAIDEADLLMSYGHKEDLTRLMDPASGWMPKLGVQGCLMSATLSEDVEGVKGLVLRNPVCRDIWRWIPASHADPQAILTLSEPTATSLLSQYFTHTTERDKFLYIYVLLKLKLIRGKSIVFVNDVERGYRVKLFLEQFGIKCCVVNSELPLSSRYHVVEEFNRGVYDVIVASDEGLGGEAEVEPVEKAEGGEAEAEVEDVEEETGDVDLDQVETTTASAQAGPSKRKTTAPPEPKRKRRRGDASSSLARGIDFTSASTVINFDLPQSTTSYFHRVGRTARAGHSGLALSFVVPKKDWGKDRTTMLKSAKADEEVFGRINKRVKDDGAEIKEWDFGGRGKEIDGFRYRMEDALRSVTTKRVSDARREEVRRELLNSEKLKVSLVSHSPGGFTLIASLILPPIHWICRIFDTTPHSTQLEFSLT